MALLAFVSVMFVLPVVPGAEICLFHQLNQELGALCQSPPEWAMKVCQLHAKLVHK